MPESKNNFIRSQMNRDLDDRLIPKGTYKTAQNVTISRSEGDDVGTFQNILGNSSISDFSFTDTSLEIIGHYIDDVNNILYLFITNYNDSSEDRLSNFAPSSALNYIIRFDINTESSSTLVSGSYLNFSKTHEVLGINLIENLLFWTDNRNQPRKINIKTAVANSSYYSSEDTISVAKFYPSKPVKYYKEVKIKATNSGTSASNLNVDFDGSDITKQGVNVGMQVYNATNVTSTTAVPGSPGYGVWVAQVNAGAPDIIGLNGSYNWAINDKFVFTEYGLKNSFEKWLTPTFFSIVTHDTASNTYSYVGVVGTADADIDIENGYRIIGLRDVEDISLGDEYLVTSLNKSARTFQVTPSLSVAAAFNGKTLGFSKQNPDFDVNFPGDPEYLKDKFVRLSYRYKFEDNEYSLMAPFTQVAFTPQQFGSFLPDDEAKAAKTSVLQFFENNVDTVEVSVYTPFDEYNSINDSNYTNWNLALDKLKIKEIEIVCKFSDEGAIKVIDVIDFPGILNLSNNGQQDFLTYSWKSTKPIRVLPEDEIVRVYDKAPIRALSQETAGNRIIYGNFLDKHTSPETLDFKISSGLKYDAPFAQTKRVYNNHSLKENRTYQVGIVLSDRYGRQSDVILSTGQTGERLVTDGDLFGDSTVYHKFGDANKFSSISGVLPWFGDQLSMLLNEPIPESITKNGYPGLYNSNNPLGWYTYKLVVKQQQQEYYNVFIPNSYQGSDIDAPVKQSYFSLINDNINKVPKDLSNVGPEDRTFSSSVNLFPRVNPTEGNNSAGAGIESSFIIHPNKKGDTVSSISQNFKQDSINSTTPPSPADIGRLGIDVDYLYKGATALTAEVQNNKVFGYDGGSPTKEWNYDILGVYETDPQVSQLDLYYETSTSGFISDLNIAVGEGDITSPTSLSADLLTFNEATATRDPQDLANNPGDVIFTLEALNGVLQPLTITSANIISATASNNSSVNISNRFTTVAQLTSGSPNGKYDVYVLKSSGPDNYFYYGTGFNWEFFVEITANSQTRTLRFGGPHSNRNPLVNQDIYPSGNTANTMPVFLEPYKNYTRLTRGTNKSLRPWYYSNPGDNDAIMGIGGNNTNKSVPSPPNYNTWLTPFDSNGTLPIAYWAIKRSYTVNDYGPTVYTDGQYRIGPGNLSGYGGKWASGDPINSTFSAGLSILFPYRYIEPQTPQGLTPVDYPLDFIVNGDVDSSTAPGSPPYTLVDAGGPNYPTNCWLSGVDYQSKSDNDSFPRWRFAELSGNISNFPNSTNPNYPEGGATPQLSRFTSFAGAPGATNGTYNENWLADSITYSIGDFWISNNDLYRIAPDSPSGFTNIDLATNEWDRWWTPTIYNDYNPPFTIDPNTGQLSPINMERYFELFGGIENPAYRPGFLESASDMDIGASDTNSPPAPLARLGVGNGPNGLPLNEYGIWVLAITTGNAFSNLSNPDTQSSLDYPCINFSIFARDEGGNVSSFPVSFALIY